MTEKELLYVEDAILHEKNIIAICNETINFLEDENLVSFLKKEIKKHESMQEKLMIMLKEKSNEWSIINGKLSIST